MEKTVYKYYKTNSFKQNRLKILSMLALVICWSYVFSVTIPIFCKEQLLRNRLKEESRCLALNCSDCKKAMEKEYRKIANEMGFSKNVNVDVFVRNHDLFVRCYTIIPMNFLTYTFDYHMHIEQVIARGGF